MDNFNCEIRDVYGPEYIPILDEWFEWDEYVDYKTYFHICCQTKFYKFLKEKGLLEKYFPKWYRNGEF